MRVQAINEDRVMVTFSNTIDLETREVISQYQAALEGLEGIASITCGYNQIMIRYDDEKINIEEALKDLDLRPGETKKNIIRIPVCYDPPYGLDTAYVCDYHQINLETLIELHSQVLYPVYMMGFVPGFPYLGDLNPDLATPRRDNPRTSIPKGAVGIGGKQTGIYPCPSPGGWQIIGQTPIDLLNLEVNDTLIHRGDYIQFYPIDGETFEKIKAGEDDYKNK